LKRLDKRGLTCLISLALCGLIPCAHAAKSIRFLTAGELQSSLLSESEDIRFNGRNYIMGVVDTLMLTKASPVCMQEQTEINAITDLVRLQMQQRPELLRYNAASVVREVMVANFPCI
jgi:hypothetical protein